MRDDAAQIALQRHVVDHHEPAAVHHLDGAAVGSVVAEVGLGDEAQRAGRGLERRRGIERLAQRAGDDLVAEARPGDRRGRAARDRRRGARTLHRVVVGAAELDGAQAAAEVDADDRVGDVRERDAGVVVLEDVLVVPAVLGVAVGAPLRHAHSVSPPVALDGERVLHGERGRRAGERQEDQQDEGAGERELAPAPGAPRRGGGRVLALGCGVWGLHGLLRHGRLLARGYRSPRGRGKRACGRRDCFWHRPRSPFLEARPTATGGRRRWPRATLSTSHRGKAGPAAKSWPGPQGRLRPRSSRRPTRR